MDTGSLAVFVNAVSTGSLSAAARQLGVAPVVASRKLAMLERELGARLLHRTTRSLSLTDEGRAFLPHAQAILDEEAEAVTALEGDVARATGLLRLTAPAALGREVIVPLLPAMLEANPRLRVELRLTERMVDLVGEGLDLAVRIADLNDVGLVARRMGKVSRVVCASPDYLANREPPATRQDLNHHECLTLLGQPFWSFEGKTGTERIRVSGRLTCDAIDGLHAACRAGGGLAMLSSWSAAEDLKTGRLVELPLDARPHGPPIQVVYPSARMVPTRVRVFINALTGALVSGG